MRQESEQLDGPLTTVCGYGTLAPTTVMPLNPKFLSVVCLGVAVGAFGGSSAAQAQTVGLRSPGASVKDTTIRGGSYGSVNFNADLLVTCASTDPEYVRR